MVSKEEVFDEIRTERGSVARIHSAFSEFPVGMKAHFEFYKKIMLEEGLPLSRVEREYLAVETSRENQCPYCVDHHRTALKNHDSKSTSLLEPARKQILLKLAKSLTLEPWKSSLTIKEMLTTGFSKAEVQHSIFVVAYFNFANRCAHAMALELEPNFEDSCR